MITLKKENSSRGIPPEKRTLEQLMQTGIIVLDKPCGPSSHEATTYARKILGLNKAGHTGTLDQDVSGVLIVLLQEACKAANFFPDSSKKYTCLMRLGKEASKKQVEEAMQNFKGKIYQKPPLASAVAKRLRIREVFDLNVLEIQGKNVLFDVHCQAGTYVRNICRDSGEVLGNGAVMTELRRTQAMGLSEKQSTQLQELSDFKWLATCGKPEKLMQAILPIEKALKLKKVVLSDEGVEKTCHGINPWKKDALSLDKNIEKDEAVLLYTGRGQAFSIAKALHNAKKAPEQGDWFDLERLILTPK
ncbi:MAG: RNA-guided pseudouridylation complex pseudouridine synthase subunit Cbf5 [Candidatus Micrarchaeia archaeon]